MPPKQNSHKSKPKRREKRKNISPLFTDTQVSDNTREPVLDSTVYTYTRSDTVYENIGSDIQNKRFCSYQSPPEYFIFDNATMSYSQQPFTGLLPSPQGQYPQFPPIAQAQTPPPWAVTLMEDVKNIKTKVDRIETVEKTVNSISSKLSQLELKVDSIDKRALDVEKNCSFISEKYDDQSKDLKTAKDEIKKLTDSCCSLKQTMDSLENDRDRLKEKVLDGEFRSMRGNLIFYGIPETSQPEQPENCDTLVKSFINDQLNINGGNMLLDRAHRLGAPRTDGSSRPIVVKFHYYHDREAARKATAPVKEDLKKSKLGVGAQIPKEWRDSRKTLQDVFSAEKRKGHDVMFRGDKLYINGRQYKPGNVQTD